MVLVTFFLRDFLKSEHILHTRLHRDRCNLKGKISAYNYNIFKGQGGKAAKGPTTIFI